MHPTFRIVALTAALAALAPAASAAQVSLDFNTLGVQAQAAGQPVAVPDMEGLRFAGAFGYGAGMLGREDPENLDVASADRGGFVMNGLRGQTTADIIITLVQNTSSAARAADSTVFFQAITFNLFTKGTGSVNKLIATGANGNSPIDLTSGGQDTWSPSRITVDLSQLREVTSLRFTAGGAAMALDDLGVTLSDATDPGGNVPEPASYGLVGLALLGAGLASRRKQRG